MGRRVLVHENARDSTSELGRFLNGTSCNKGTCDIYWYRFLNLDSLSSVNNLVSPISVTRFWSLNLQIEANGWLNPLCFTLYLEQQFFNPEEQHVALSDLEYLNSVYRNNYIIYMY